MDEFTVTYKKPKKAVLREGDSITAGKYKFRADRIDEETKSVKCSLMDGEGKVLAEKTFGPVDDEIMDTFPQYAPSQEKITLKYADLFITLNIPANLAGGNAAFYVATDAVTYHKDEPWPDDPRFVVRPDVCGHCYQLNEVILDNKDPVILDRIIQSLRAPTVTLK